MTDYRKYLSEEAQDFRTVSRIILPGSKYDIDIRKSANLHVANALMKAAKELNPYKEGKPIIEEERKKSSWAEREPLPDDDKIHIRVRRRKCEFNFND